MRSIPDGSAAWTMATARLSTKAHIREVHMPIQHRKDSAAATASSTRRSSVRATSLSYRDRPLAVPVSLERRVYSCRSLGREPERHG